MIRSWDDRPHDRSFVRVLEPPKDEGTAFLRDHETMWTWLPRVERAMRIPPSMMLQSWMESDFTNDDLARESSLEKDYVPVLAAEETIDGVTAWRLELRPKPEAPVVYAKLELTIEKERYAPLLYVYYDEPEPGTAAAVFATLLSMFNLAVGDGSHERWIDHTVRLYPGHYEVSLAG